MFEVGLEDEVASPVTASGKKVKGLGKYYPERLPSVQPPPIRVPGLEDERKFKL